MNEQSQVCGTCERVNDRSREGVVSDLVARELGNAAVVGCQNVCPRATGLVGVRLADGTPAVGYVADYGDGGDVPAVVNVRRPVEADRSKNAKIA